MTAVTQDLRFAARMLVKRPLFTVVAVVALGLGIGANTTIFSVVNALLLRDLAVADQSRLVTVSKVHEDRSAYHAFSYPGYHDLRDRARSVTGIASWEDRWVSVSTGAEPERLYVSVVSGNYFSLLGIAPAAGRMFTAEEDRVEGAHPIVVLSHALWRDRFGGQASTVGRSVTINGHRFTVVGIAPEEFSGLQIGPAPSLWIPSAMTSRIVHGGTDEWTNRGLSGLQLVARLREDVPAEKADAELDNILAGIRAANPTTSEGHGVHVEAVTGIPGNARGDVMSFMAILMSVATLVLLIACVNVASMLMARAIARRREIAIRLAMGAGRGRIIRQLLVESVLLFVVGAAAGTLIAMWATDLLLAFLPPFDVPVEIDFSVDRTVLLFTLGVALLTGVLFGLAPALRASRPELVPSLKEAAPASRGGRSRMRSAFIVAQVCLSVILLVCSGLFLRSLQRATDYDLGMDTDDVEVTSLYVSLSGYDAPRATQLYASLVERIEALPGVESAGLTSLIPLSGGSITVSTFVEGARTDRDGENLNVSMVSPSYFSTLRIPLLAGRGLRSSDRPGGQQVAVINEAMARHFWPGVNPIGRRFSHDGPSGPWIEVVGVVATGRYTTIDEAPTPHIFRPIAQHYVPYAAILVRTPPGSASVMPQVRGELAALDPNLPLVGAASLESHVGVTLLPQRIAATIAGTFGGLGLILAGVGIYGLVAYSVAQRTHELGIRAALGATRRNLLAMVLRQGMRPVAIGLAIGLAGAAALSRLLETFLLGVSPTDPFTFIVVPVVLALVSTAAVLVPARRATRVDPMSALRYE